MPRKRTSKHDESARLRRKFTGESFQSALAGVGRKGSIGLDECSPEQLSFRAHLALGLFNTGDPGKPPAAWNMGRTHVYDPVVSPRWGLFIFIAHRAPYNAARTLLPRRELGDPGSRLPGLRLIGTSSQSRETVLMLHEPSGARFAITGLSHWSPKEAPRSLHRDASWWEGYLSQGDSLTEIEKEEISAIPSMSSDARILLAGLTNRYSLKDPDKKWKIEWDSPPRKPGTKERTRWSRPDLVNRRLWGEDNHWTIEYNQGPHPEALTAALTHPISGITGASSNPTKNSQIIKLGSAKLEIMDPPVHNFYSHTRNRSQGNNA